MDKKELELCVRCYLSTREIAEKKNVSQTNVRHWLKKYGLKTQRRPKQYPICPTCAKKVMRRGNKYCSNECFQKGRKSEFNELSSHASRRRRFLAEEVNECAICKVKEWIGHPVPLTLDHIDGNSEHNERSNLRLICPNCDALLPTFKGRNRGNGRHKRMERYHTGKSY